MSTTEELLASGMATLVPQSTIDTDAPGEDEALLPDIDETPSAGSSDADSQDQSSLLGSPTILVTDLEGESSAGNKTRKRKQKPNTDAPGSFSQVSAENPVGEVKKPRRFKLKGWSLGLAGAKAASRTHRRAGSLSRSRSGQSAS